MKHIALTPFGQRPVTAGLLATRALAETAPDHPAVDKWTILTRLRIARVRFGVSDRDIAVLAALLSFLPARELAGDAALIVYPSNASLSDRAHGMAESTLRRHLGALVTAGLICRQDSPNGKRYAARGPGGVVETAFGFDLRPLLARATAITDAATDAERTAALLTRQRTDLVLRLRDAEKLSAFAIEDAGAGVADWETLTERLSVVRQGLRRKMAVADLTALGSVLKQAEIGLARLLRTVFPEEMDGNAIQNERHHLDSNTDKSDLEPYLEKGRAETSGEPTKGDLPHLPLALVLKACPDVLPYARHPITNWDHLVAIADQVRGMMGISASAWADARVVMGPEVAAVALAGILQRFGSIRNAGGYLRSLTRQAGEGRFSPGPMIMALLAGAES